jgi:hypothetical protein
MILRISETRKSKSTEVPCLQYSAHDAVRRRDTQPISSAILASWAWIKSRRPARLMNQGHVGKGTRRCEAQHNYCVVRLRRLALDDAGLVSEGIVGGNADGQ